MKQFWQHIQRRTPLGWLQLRRERNRLYVALVGIAFADILMFMQLGFQSALYDSNSQLSRALKADIVLLNPQAPYPQNLGTFSRRRLYQAMDFPGVQSAEAFYSSTINWRHPSTRKNILIQVIAFNPARSVLNIAEVNQQLDKLKLPDHVLFDRKSRGKTRASYKQMIALIESGKSVSTEVDFRTVTVAGVFNLGASFGSDVVLVASDQTFLHFFPRRQPSNISLGLIQIKPGYDAQQVTAALSSYLPKDVRVLTHNEYIAFEENYWRNESPIGFIFGFGTAMSFVVGVAIVYQVLSTDVNSHLQEYATFKAMGYQNKYLLTVVFEQAIIMAILGFIPGFALSIGLYQMAAGATALPIYMKTSRAIFVFLLTLMMCILSGAIATRRLQYADPAEMF
uniref:DevC protein n=1 Tax=Cyanothece sp. (strain PCC 7425 / ATCC 29141) TaxID=395961 RepID=B8HL02_CYAP4